jgi:recombination protein RecT
MTTTQAAVAKREAPRASALVAQYRSDFTTVLPSHMRADTWVRVAQGALKRGKKAEGDPAGRTELEVAATNNPAAFLSAMLDAARLGLEPGTEQFYLTPRKVKGRLEILGIVGWQGYVELMYRAGAVSSVVAEVVHAADHFQFRPGRDEVPDHDIDWDAEDRGPLRLAYAYARMKDGSTSKVVVLNRAAIERAKKSSQGSDSQYSPWQQHEAAMWLKTAVRQLAKWVPTSAERYSVTGQPVTHVQVEREDRPEPAVTNLPLPAGGLDEAHVDYRTGEIHDAELIDEDDVPEGVGEPIEREGDR